MTNQIIANKLHEIQDSISGVLNHSEIQEKLNFFGYDATKLAEGQAKLDNVMELTARQIDLYGDQYGATDVFGKSWEQAYSDYMVVVKIMRVAFKNDIDSLKSYLATGARRRSLSGWLADARITYGNLLNNPDSLLILSGYGIARRRITEGLRQVEEIQQLHTKQLEKKGEAQQATLERDKAFDDLTNWYSDFRAVARIALYERPQLIEALGIVLPTTKFK
jgi:hypothetical protein